MIFRNVCKCIRQNKRASKKLFKNTWLNIQSMFSYQFPLLSVHSNICFYEQAGANTGLTWGGGAKRRLCARNAHNEREDPITSILCSLILSHSLLWTILILVNGIQNIDDKKLGGACCALSWIRIRMSLFPIKLRKEKSHDVRWLIICILYTGWPRKNATPAIIDFKKTRDRIQKSCVHYCV